jgi:hypothetical protein
MRMFWLAASAATLAISLSTTAAIGQSVSAPAPAPGLEVPPAAVLDPGTLAALDKMGVALRKLDSFTVRAETTDEKVLTNGQKIQFSGFVEAKAQRPNRFRVDRVSDRQARTLYYDGKVVTLYSPRMGFYGSAPVTGTIQEVVAAVAERYDIETPLADLFSWGVDPAATARIKSAIYVGAQTIDGVACDQYALREDTVDWQVWLPQKGEALPCKLVITSADEPSMPQYSAVFKWAPRQAHPASTFVFVPPKGSQKIALAKAPAEPASASAQ